MAGGGLDDFRNVAAAVTAGDKLFLEILQFVLEAGGANFVLPSGEPVGGPGNLGKIDLRFAGLFESSGIGIVGRRKRFEARRLLVKQQDFFCGGGNLLAVCFCGLSKRESCAKEFAKRCGRFGLVRGRGKLVEQCFQFLSGFFFKLLEVDRLCLRFLLRELPGGLRQRALQGIDVRADEVEGELQFSASWESVQWPGAFGVGPEAQRALAGFQLPEPFLALGESFRRYQKH